MAFAAGIGFPGVYIGQAVSPFIPAVVGWFYFKSRGWENRGLTLKKTEQDKRQADGLEERAVERTDR